MGLDKGSIVTISGLLIRIEQEQKYSKNLSKEDILNAKEVLKDIIYLVRRDRDEEVYKYFEVLFRIIEKWSHSVRVASRSLRYTRLIAQEIRNIREELENAKSKDKRWMGN